MSDKTKSVLKGFAIAMIGAGLTYVTKLTTGMDLGDLNLITAALLATAANALRKWADMP